MSARTKELTAEQAEAEYEAAVKEADRLDAEVKAGRQPSFNAFRDAKTRVEFAFSLWKGAEEREKREDLERREERASEIKAVAAATLQKTTGDIIQAKAAVAKAIETLLAVHGHHADACATLEGARHELRPEDPRAESPEWLRDIRKFGPYTAATQAGDPIAHVKHAVYTALADKGFRHDDGRWIASLREGGVESRGREIQSLHDYLSRDQEAAGAASA